MVTHCNYNPICSLLVIFILMWFLSSYLDTIKFCLGDGNLRANCWETEREALLAFREDLIDPSGRLSSWVGEDCCKWRGVGCNNQTGLVIKLNLRNPVQFTDDYLAWENSCLYGKINPSLLHLKYLNYLDLSSNYFDVIEIPTFFGSLKNLRYLNLSYATFYGEIPPHLGNLSRLHYLDLSSNFQIHAKNLHWLASLSSLKYLNLGNVDLSSTGQDWLQSINMLTSLLELHLPLCELRNLSLFLPLVNFTSLLTLNMQSNLFNYSLPNWMLNLTSLQILDLSMNHFKGPISRLLGNLCGLKILDLSSNDFNSEIQEFSGCLNSSIVSLDLVLNMFVGKLPESLGILKNLEYFDLHYNSFWGSIPASIGNLTSLKLLDLSDNQMNGTIPESFGQLSELVNVDLSSPNNSWVGVLTEAHLMNLTRLERIRLVTNPPNSLVFNVSYDWVPPFRLKYIHIENCHIGTFARWLRVQSELTYVKLKNTGISDTFPKEWLSMISSKLTSLDLSINHFKGKLPHQLVFQNLGEGEIDLSSNLFEGPIPLWSTNATTLCLQDNLFSGPIPENISGLMPNLIKLYLSWNHLDGKIPSSICQLDGLVVLSLRSNNFSGKLFDCWSKMPMLWGVDISNNSISGRIPRSMGSLFSLHRLLLSNNILHGKIPKKIGNLRWLETLDLSHNRLSGPIPQSLSSLTSLTYLNLSYNNLEGQIPTGNQLQTLNDSSIYEGNPLLCGVPLQTKCPGGETSTGPTPAVSGIENHKDGDNFDRLWFFISVIVGFFVGFWGVCGTLLVKKTWRQAFFWFVDDMRERVSFTIALKVAHLQRKF